MAWFTTLMNYHRPLKALDANKVNIQLLNYEITHRIKKQ